jgi:hypothetical protein
MKTRINKKAIKKCEELTGLTYEEVKQAQRKTNRKGWFICLYYLQNPLISNSELSRIFGTQPQAESYRILKALPKLLKEKSFIELKNKLL